MSKVNRPKKYAYVPLPREIYNEVEKIIENRELGYISVADFVREAVREKMLSIKKVIA